MTRRPSALRRLLRSRWCYVVIGGLALLLYARIFHLRASEEHPAPTVNMESVELWPRELDAAALRRAAREKPLAALAWSGLSALMVGMGLVGGLSSLWALVTGRIRAVWRFPSQRVPAWSFGDLGRIVLLVLLIAAALPWLHLGIAGAQARHATDHHAWLTTSMLALDASVVLLILTFAGWQGRSVRETLGVAHRPWAAIRTGLRGYLAAFPWLFALLWLMVLLARRFGWQLPVEPIQELMFEEQRPWIVGLTVVLACVIGPLAEELLFRGVLYAALRQRVSRVMAMIASGTCFSLLHTNAVGFVPIMLLGCLLAHLYERTGSLLGPLAVHVVHNTILLSLALTFRALLGGSP